MNKLWCLFSDSAKEFKQVRNVAGIAMLLALNIVLSFFGSFYLFPWLRVGTSFIASAMIGMIYGPSVAMTTGVAGDIIGYLLKPVDGYFFGFTLTALLSGMIWGIFLYKNKMTWVRVILAKTTITIFLNCILNTVWQVILKGEGFEVLFWPRVGKNLILLPMEILVVYLVGKALNKGIERIPRLAA